MQSADDLFENTDLVMQEQLWGGIEGRVTPA